MPHPWNRPTYDAKRHPDQIRRFPTMDWTGRPTDRQTDRPTDRSRESLTTNNTEGRSDSLRLSFLLSRCELNVRPTMLVSCVHYIAHLYFHCNKRYLSLSG